MVPHRVIAVIGSLTCLLASCSSPLSPDEVLALGRAEARWAARAFDSYTYETVTSCGECPDIMRQQTRVVVSNGKVVGAVLVANDSVLPTLTSFTTIDGLFAQIRRYQHEDWVRDVIVAFDPQLGYPTSISTFGQPGTMDAGGAIFISNLVPTP
jgi:hypothetical protein